MRARDRVRDRALARESEGKSTHCNTLQNIITHRPCARKSEGKRTCERETEGKSKRYTARERERASEGVRARAGDRDRDREREKTARPLHHVKLLKGQPH